MTGLGLLQPSSATDFHLANRDGAITASHASAERWLVMSFASRRWLLQPSNATDFQHEHRFLANRDGAIAASHTSASADSCASDSGATRRLVMSR